MAGWHLRMAPTCEQEKKCLRILPCWEEHDGFVDGATMPKLQVVDVLRRTKRNRT